MDNPATRLRECTDCGQMQRVPWLGPGALAACMRCDAVLRRGHGDPLHLPLALNLAGLFLLLIACGDHLMDVSKLGIERTATLITGPQGLSQDGLWQLGAIVLYTTIAGPLIQLAGMTYVLLAIRLGRERPITRRIFAWLRHLRPWSMVEVYLVGVFVAYTRLRSLVDIEIGIGLWALIALMLVMTVADATLDPQAVWERLEQRDRRRAPPRPDLSQAIGCDTCMLVSAPVDRCPRCGSHLRARKPYSIARTWALAIAALILYVPANLYPVLTYTQLGSGAPSTIIGGARELLDAGEWPLALIVFVASIAVPVLKLFSLFLMLIMTGRGSAAKLHDRTRLYRIVSVIGRWSMIDIFMESILVALVQFGGIVSILPGYGAVAFAAVVVLTIFAAESFDPRLMWDAAGQPA